MSSSATASVVAESAANTVQLALNSSTTLVDAQNYTSKAVIGVSPMSNRNTTKYNKQKEAKVCWLK